MQCTKWTSAEIALLQEKYPVCNMSELQVLFPNRTVKMIESAAKRFKIRKAVRPHKFTPEQIAEIRREYPNTDSRELAGRLGCSLRSIYNMANKQLNLKKSPAFITEQHKRLMSDPNHGSQKTRFKKGIIPQNKGKKMEEWKSPEQIANFRANQYKPGHKPWQTKSNGAISVRKYKNGHIYKYIRISESRWEMLSRHVWKKHHGAIPAGHNIQFKDGDSLNCDISNLYLISRSDQLRTENSLLVRYPKDIRIAIQAKGALYRQINKLKSKEDEHEHDKD